MPAGTRTAKSKTVWQQQLSTNCTRFLNASVRYGTPGERPGSTRRASARDVVALRAGRVGSHYNVMNAMVPTHVSSRPRS